jgi:hypothetical protein
VHVVAAELFGWLSWAPLTWKETSRHDDPSILLLLVLCPVDAGLRLPLLINALFRLSQACRHNDAANVPKKKSLPTDLAGDR